MSQNRANKSKVTIQSRNQYQAEVTRQCTHISEVRQQFRSNWAKIRSVIKEVIQGSAMNEETNNALQRT